MKKKLMMMGFMVGLALFWAIMVGKNAQAGTIFSDDFDSGSLDPAWDVTDTGVGSYTLANGKLNYLLTGVHGSTGAWKGTNSWSPTTTLSRQFSGTNWEFETKLNFSLVSNVNGGSTGAQSAFFYLAFDKKNYVGLVRSVDWWYDSLAGADILGTGDIFYTIDGVATSCATFQDLVDIYDALVDGIVSNEYFLKIIRSDNEIIAALSHDGSNYMTAFDVTFASLPDTQTIYLDETLWSPAGSQISYDYMRASTVPEPSTMLLLGAGIAGLSWLKLKRKEVKEATR